MRRPLLRGAALCLALSVAACGGGDDDKSEADIKADLSETLQSGTDFDEAAADCFAEIVIDEVGLDEMREVNLSDDEPPAELQDEIAAAAQRASEECDLAEPAGLTPASETKEPLMSDDAPGWQADPSGKHDHRYWDGSRWTDDVADAGVAGTDAYEPPTVADTPAVGAFDAPPPAPVDPTVVSGASPADTTAAWPTTPGGPAAPAPPPPYVPGGPAGTDGGSKRNLLIGGGILAAVVIAVLAFLALSGDDDDGDLASNDADATSTTEREDGGEGSYGSDPELDALYDDCAEGDYDACDQLFFDSPSGSEYEEFGDTCGDRNEPSGTCVELYEGGDSGGVTDGLSDGGDLPADFEEILADTYEQSLGLDREKAECLADALASDIESGDLDESEAMSAFMEYISDCDISMEELGAN